MKRLIAIAREIANETRGNPSIVLMDGQDYKPIPTALADRLEAIVNEVAAPGR